jgi:hypothetical protein
VASPGASPRCLDYLLLIPIQDELGTDGVHIPLIYYADATLISNFRGKLFHPVIMRIGNIPSCVRNTYQRGGGALVGYISAVYSCFLSFVYGSHRYR